MKDHVGQEGYDLHGGGQSSSILKGAHLDKFNFIIKDLENYDIEVEGED